MAPCCPSRPIRISRTIFGSRCPATWDRMGNSTIWRENSASNCGPSKHRNGLLGGLVSPAPELATYLLEAVASAWTAQQRDQSRVTESCR